MLRSRQERETLIRRFEEIAPFLKTKDNYTYDIPPICDPRYKIYPTEESIYSFKSFDLNVKTGRHSEIIYRDDKGVLHRIQAGITPVDEVQWQCDNYSRDCKAIDGHKTNK